MCGIFAFCLRRVLCFLGVLCRILRLCGFVCSRQCRWLFRAFFDRIFGGISPIKVVKVVEGIGLHSPALRELEEFAALLLLFLLLLKRREHVQSEQLRAFLPHVLHHTRRPWQAGKGRSAAEVERAVAGHRSRERGGGERRSVGRSFTPFLPVVRLGARRCRLGRAQLERRIGDDEVVSPLVGDVDDLLDWRRDFRGRRGDVRLGRRNLVLRQLRLAHAPLAEELQQHADGHAAQRVLVCGVGADVRVRRPARETLVVDALAVPDEVFVLLRELELGRHRRRRRVRVYRDVLEDVLLLLVADPALVDGVERHLRERDGLRLDQREVVVFALVGDRVGVDFF